MAAASIATASGLARSHWLLAISISAALMVTMLALMFALSPALWREVRAFVRAEGAAGYVV
jgi:hypothetical protein